MQILNFKAQIFKKIFENFAKFRKIIYNDENLSGILLVEVGTRWDQNFFYF